MVRVKSYAEDGVYYLVNGWELYENFWHRNGKDPRCHFQNLTDAKTSVTKLFLKMPDYRDDIIVYEEKVGSLWISR